MGAHGWGLEVVVLFAACATIQLSFHDCDCNKDRGYRVGEYWGRWGMQSEI